MIRVLQRKNQDLDSFEAVLHFLCQEDLGDCIGVAEIQI